ncbi:hypothetical protein JKY79_00505 [Candidatus Babeliales bacterium]|nr:hypothetical protein [Candidatus Babeliales bacterium]
MIDQIQGVVTAHYEKSIQVNMHGCGFLLYVAEPSIHLLDSTATFLTHFHWNQDRGPSLYGFENRLDRSLFLHLIDVPKIGPNLAMQLMSQSPSAMLISLIQDEKIKQLSGYHGLGAKKAEQIVYSLKKKIKTLATLVPTSEMSSKYHDSSKINDVLISLGYSKQEVTSALSFINNTEEQSFDTLLRTALSYLSKHKML